ncbi:MAG: tol-pal system protein YbgF [Nitrospira sp.]|nr:tol-pal system protein YbgF [Nitrospira sp.]
MRKAETAIPVVLSILLFGCVAQESDLRHTERVLQQRIKQQDEQLSQARARQGQEIATLRDHELPRLQGEVERAFHLAQELEAKQEDIRHRLAQLEQQVKKMDADNATRYAWIQKSFDTQDAKVAAKLNELSRATETVVAGMKKDIIDAVQRTNDILAKRVNERLEEQEKETADHRQRLNQSTEKFVQFNQALTGFREALTELHEQADQREQATGKSLESLSQNIQVLSTRIAEQDRRIESLVRLVEAGNTKTDTRQSSTRSAPRSDDPSLSDAEPGLADRSRFETGAASAAFDRPGTAPASITITPPKESTPSESTTAKADPPPDRVQYERVLALFRHGDLEGARNGFAAFLSEYPNSDLAPNARYWQGEAYYGEKEYQKAIDAYNLVELHYPRSDKVPAAILKKGYAYLALKDKKRAESAFKQVMTLYPKSQEAGKASDKLAQLKTGR